MSRLKVKKKKKKGKTVSARSRKKINQALPKKIWNALKSTQGKKLDSNFSKFDNPQCSHEITNNFPKLSAKKFDIYTYTYICISTLQGRAWQTKVLKPTLAVCFYTWKFTEMDTNIKKKKNLLALDAGYFIITLDIREHYHLTN